MKLCRLLSVQLIGRFQESFMPATRSLRFTAAAFVLVFALASRAEDRTRAIETPINWHLNPFQEGGCGWPGPFNTSAFNGIVEIVLKRDVACERIDRAFQTAGFRMVHNVTFDRDGVVFRPTGYDREREVGYVWGTPESLGEGFFGRPPDVSDEEKAARLSAAEAQLLEDRAPMTREFIAVIIPYTNRLGYSSGAYRNDREKASLEKLGADTEAKRLAALDNAVADYVR
jgi:hypothetical protein